MAKLYFRYGAMSSSKTANALMRSLVGSEMCIRDRVRMPSWSSLP